MRIIKWTVLLFAFILTSCQLEQDTTYLQKVDNPELFQRAMQNLTDIIVGDIFSPPVASRVYLYPMTAAYEIIASKYPEKYNSLVGQVKGLRQFCPRRRSRKLHSLPVVLTVGKALIFSENMMERFEEQFDAQLKEMKYQDKYQRPQKLRQKWLPLF